MLEFKDLLILTLLHKEDIGVPILKTRLIKLAYLIELEYYRSFRERITSAEWVYYKYGPYVHQYDQTLNDREFEQILSGPDDEYSIIGLKLPITPQNINNKVMTIVNRVIKKYGHLDLHTLLDHVYFNTEPMMHVLKVNAPLDFDMVLPKNEYSNESKIIPAHKLIKIKEDIRRRMLNARRL